MEITLALVVLGIIVAMGVWLFTWGACKSDEDKIILAGQFLIVALLLSGLRYLSINDENKNKAARQAYELCVKEGKQFKEVLGSKVCVYE